MSLDDEIRAGLEADNKKLRFQLGALEPDLRAAKAIIETLTISNNMLSQIVEGQERFLLHLVDVVWGVANEDESVPGTDWAKRMIEQAKKSFKEAPK